MPASVSTYAWIRSIMQGPGVRRVLDEVAARIAASAQAIVDKDNLGETAGTVVQSTGTRPRGRPYSRVGITHRTRAQAQAELAAANGGSEFGTSTQQRTRLVGRAVSAARSTRGGR